MNYAKYLLVTEIFKTRQGKGPENL